MNQIFFIWEGETGRSLSFKEGHENYFLPIPTNRSGKIFLTPYLFGATNSQRNGWRWYCICTLLYWQGRQYPSHPLAFHWLPRLHIFMFRHCCGLVCLLTLAGLSSLAIWHLFSLAGRWQREEIIWDLRCWARKVSGLWVWLGLGCQLQMKSEIDLQWGDMADRQR